MKIINFVHGELKGKEYFLQCVHLKMYKMINISDSSYFKWQDCDIFGTLNWLSLR